MYFNKPMIIYNSHDVDWKNMPFYKFWNWGYVVDNPEERLKIMHLARSMGKLPIEQL